MITNHIRTSFRHLLRNRLMATLNIAGLAIALASSFLVLLYLDFHLGHDQYLANSDRIFRIDTRVSENGVERPWSSETYFGLAEWLNTNTPDLIATRFYRWPANAGILFEA